MNAPVITAVATWVPDAVPVSRWHEMESAHCLVQRPGWNAWVTSWQLDYGHWPEASENSDTEGLLPVGHDLTWVDAVPVETATDLSGLAAKVANAICAARKRGAPSVDIVMFCHSSLDEHVSTTTAGRLRDAIGTPCFPFSVSQQQGASVFTALHLATDLFIAEPDLRAILIVAAEKWCPPFSRWTEPGILQGDAAGALLVERPGNATRGLRLMDASTRTVVPPNVLRLQRACVRRAWTPALASMIEDMLARHQLRPGDICEVVGHRGFPQLTTTVCGLPGRQDTGLPNGHRLHLGAAESIVRLAQLLGGIPLQQHDKVLLWGFGLGGYLGTALLEACGTPSLHLRGDTRHLP